MADIKVCMDRERLHIIALIIFLRGKMVDIATVLSILTPVLISIISLIYWLGGRFTLIDERFKSIYDKFKSINERLRDVDDKLKSVDDRFSKIDERLNMIDSRINEMNMRLMRVEGEIMRLRDVFLQYNEILLSVFEAKNILSKSEILALKGVLSSLKPNSASKYYTKDVAKRLDELLAKDPEELTLSDLEELRKIADLIWREGYESGREDLREYGMKLYLYTMLVKVVFIYPKLRKLREESFIKPA